MRPTPLLAVLLLACATASPGPSPGAPSDAIASSPELRALDAYTLAGRTHLVHGLSPRTPAGRVRAVIEIPAGTNAKWEVDKADGALKWEFRRGAPRVVSYLPYPGNYGMIPQTLLASEDGGDGDPLDVLVLGPALPRGSVVEVKLLGVLRLLDGGEQDDKLLAVLEDSPLGAVNDVEELERSFSGVTRIVETWFVSYKGPGEMQSQGFSGRREAERILETAIASWRHARGARVLGFRGGR